MLNNSHLQDTLTNLISKLGTSGDKSYSNLFTSRLLSDHQLEMMYRGDWTGRQIVDVPAKDATKKWRTWIGDDDKVKRITAEEKRLGLKQKILMGHTFRRLYGGAGLYLNDGGRPETEISPSRLSGRGIRSIHVFSSRRLSITQEFNHDLTSERFGQPEFYQLSTEGSAATRVHASRIIPLRGALTGDSVVADDWWGDSILRAAYDAVQNAAKVPQLVSSMFEEAKVDVIRDGNLANKLMTDEGYNNVAKRWNLGNLNKSVNGMLLLDGSEELITREIGFQNHDKLIMVFLLIVCGAADIPATRLLGQSAVGLSATGEGDLKNYYDSISAVQENDLSPALDEIDAYIMAKLFGEGDQGLSYEWTSLWSLDEKQQAEKDSKDVESITKLAGSQMVNGDALKVAVEDKLSQGTLLPGFKKALADAGEIDHLDGVVPVDEDEAEVDVDETIEAGLGDARPRTLYIKRAVTNAEEIISWARGQGIDDLLNADDLHVTIAYSRAPVDWFKIHQNIRPEIEIVGGPRLVERFGKATVLLFKSDELDWRWHDLKEVGASWDFPDYQPHITVTYSGDGGVENIEPYQGPIHLGPEVFSEIDPNWGASKNAS